MNYRRNGNREGAQSYLRRVSEKRQEIIIIFVLYINDLPENIVSNVYMFGDDRKVFKTINSPNDQHKLHNYLYYLI